MADMEKFSMEQTNISLKLAKQVISSEAKDRNFVFSPLSIHILLGLVAAGSTGQTLKELLAYLKASSSEDFNSYLSQLVSVLFADGTSLGGPRLSCSNVVWIAQQFILKPEFKNIVQNAYNTVLDSVDFQNKDKVEAAANKVNQWAEAETNGLIKEVISSGFVDALTELVFGNAVYFNGAWVEQFNPWSTTRRTFSLMDGSSVQVPFMSKGAGNGRPKCFGAFDGFKVLCLPYKKGNDARSFSMYIFLPDATDGLPALVEKVTSEPGFIEQHLPNKAVGLKDMSIPKFKISFQFEVTNVLKKLGVVSAFQGGHGISKMVNDDLFISSISHKSCIEVNEHGTEAAAVTFVICGGGSSEHFPTFVADHPFLFVIRENTTGLLLFIGHVLNPLAG